MGLFCYMALVWIAGIDLRGEGGNRVSKMYREKLWIYLFSLKLVLDTMT